MKLKTHDSETESSFTNDRPCKWNTVCVEFILLERTEMWSIPGLKQGPNHCCFCSVSRLIFNALGDYIASHHRTIGKQWLAKDLEGRSRGLIWSTILTSALREQGKLRKSRCPRHFLRTNEERFYVLRLARWLLIHCPCDSCEMCCDLSVCVEHFSEVIWAFYFIC